MNFRMRRSLFYSTESIFLTSRNEMAQCVIHCTLQKKVLFCFRIIYFLQKLCLRTDSPFVRLGRPWALSWSLSSQKNAVDPIAVERAETSSPDRSRKHDCDLTAPCRVFENFVLSAFYRRREGLRWMSVAHICSSAHF